jgi:hypothetical protein
MQKLPFLLMLCISIIATLPFALASTGPPGCMNPTVVDGYILFANGTPVAGANVTISTSASDCNLWSTISEPSGYYAIPGLNILNKQVNGLAKIYVTIPGKEGLYDGINGSYSPSSTLRLNITIRPSSPRLVDISDRHNGTNIVFAWQSGIEPSTDSTYDEFALLPNSFERKTSPQILNLPFGTYTWAVRTCNSKVCSAQSTNTFSVYNNPPSQPILNEISYSNDTSVTLSWKSGIDTDTLPKDSLIDEIQVSYDPSFSSTLYSLRTPTTDGASQSIDISNLSNLRQVYWRVRTCDNTFAQNNCSAFSQSSFFVAKTVAGVCPPCPPCEYYVTTKKPSYFIFSKIPDKVFRGSSFEIALYFNGSQNVAKLLFKAAGSGIACEEKYLYNYSANTKAEVTLTCVVDESAQLGQTKLLLQIFADSALIAEEPLGINIVEMEKEKAVCGNGICEAGENSMNCPADCQIYTLQFQKVNLFWLICLIFALLLTIYFVWENYFKKEKLKIKFKI